jgi:hypothetical protein
MNVNLVDKTFQFYELNSSWQNEEGEEMPEATNEVLVP